MFKVISSPFPQLIFSADLPYLKFIQQTECIFYEKDKVFDRQMTEMQKRHTPLQNFQCHSQSLQPN